MLRTDRRGAMKANHHVPQTSKVPVLCHLLATMPNSLSPNVERGGEDLEEVPADKERSIQTDKGEKTQLHFSVAVQSKQVLDCVFFKCVFCMNNCISN